VVLQRLDDLAVAELEQPRRCSITVTLVPSAANMDAYSMPITPAPTTTSDDGIQSRLRMSSESRIVRPSNSTLEGRAGRVPTAITILEAETVRSSPLPPCTATLWGSTKRALPSIIAMWFRPSWFRTTSTSALITCSVRQNRSWLDMSCLTR
jgi:hypothetical protein